MLRIWTVLIAPLHIMEQSAVRYSVTDNAVAASGIKYGRKQRAEDRTQAERGAGSAGGDTPDIRDAGRI